MERQYLFAPGLLVQPVYILGDHRAEFSLPLKRGERQVRGVRLCVRIEHSFLIEIIKLLRV